jgi:hypothetical protein
MPTLIQAPMFKPPRYVANQPGKDSRISWTDEPSEAKRFSCAGDAAAFYFQGSHRDWPRGIRPIDESEVGK